MSDQNENPPAPPPEPPAAPADPNACPEHPDAVQSVNGCTAEGCMFYAPRDEKK